MNNVMKQTFYKKRAAFEQQLAVRDKRFEMPEGVLIQKDLPYAKDSEAAHRFDLYRPQHSEGKQLPVIINVHGGGLILGDKTFNRYFCANLCKQGFLVCSIEYRLVPDCLFFDQCRDVFQAMSFLETALPSYGGNPEQIYDVGDSGGACLLTYCIAMQNNPNIARAAQITPAALPVRALGLISGMFYTNRPDSIGLFLPKFLYGKDYKKSAFAPYINPEHKDIVTALPPALLVTSHNDNLHHYTIHFTQALSRENRPHKLIDYPKDARLTHAFSVFEPFYKESLEVVEALADFFLTYS